MNLFAEGGPWLTILFFSVLFLVIFRRPLGWLLKLLARSALGLVFLALWSQSGLAAGLAEAAAHRHHGAGVLPLDAVDHLPGLLVADGGDGAGIHHIGVGLVGKFHYLMSFCPEGLLHSLRLILIYLAAKGVNGNFHRFSLRFQNRSYIMNNYAIERDFRGDSRDFPPIIRLFSE